MALFSREEISQCENFDLCFRLDVASKLGLSDEDIDRLKLRSQYQDAMVNAEGWLHMAADNTIASPDPGDLGQVEFKTGQLEIISKVTDQANFQRTSNQLIWNGMPAAAQKKWIALGGKPPKN